MLRSSFLRATQTLRMASSPAVIVVQAGRQTLDAQGSALYVPLLAAAVTVTMAINVIPSQDKTLKCAGIIGVVGGPTCDAR